MERNTMILLLDTSTPRSLLTLIDDGQTVMYEWQADRQLAKGLLKWLHDKLAEQGKSLSDISAIGVFQGPGSFTGLRIGLSVLNTLASSLTVPIVGATGDDWHRVAVARIQANEDDKIVLPFYGSDANITHPRK